MVQNGVNLVILLLQSPEAGITVSFFLFLKANSTSMIKNHLEAEKKFVSTSVIWVNLDLEHL